MIMIFFEEDDEEEEDEISMTRFPMCLLFLSGILTHHLRVTLAG